MQALVDNTLDRAIADGGYCAHNARRAAIER
jgi:hypothetical protein